jgi:hypothetical protein
VILSLRSPVLPALAALAAGCAVPFTMAPFTIVYCEDGGPQPIHCDCTRAPKEVAGGRVGGVDIREYDRAGALKRQYRQDDPMQFVLLDRWLVITVQSRSTSPSTLQAWLECGDASFTAEVLHRGIDRDDSGFHEHEFLALFPGSPADDAPRRCAMHVVFADSSGWTLSRMLQHVYAVDRVRRAEPTFGLTWDVLLPDDPVPLPADTEAELAPPPEPAEPRLCR